MRHWWLLATRNWWAKPGRSAAVVLAIALGVGTVITVLSIYLSVEYAIGDRIATNWIGRSDMTIETPKGHWGTIRAGLETEVAKLPNVVHTTLRYKAPMRVRIPQGIRLSARTYRVGNGFVEADIVGIQPESEYHFREHQSLEGRQLKPGDRKKIVLERRLANDLGLKVGDAVELEPLIDEPTVSFEVVGTYAGKRVAFFQRPTVYVHLEDMYDMGKPRGRATVLDVIAKDDSANALEATANRVRDLLRQNREGYEVVTATSKLDQLRAARRFTRLLLLLFSSVALLTSFFIIVTTMSMGMVQRIRILGTLRCVGVTRSNMVGLLLAEILPLGVIGIVLGIPVGWGLTRAGVTFIPELHDMIQQVHFGLDSIGPAALGGLITTLAAAAIVLLQVSRVTPLEATRPQAKSTRIVSVFVAAAIGVVLLVVHRLMVRDVDPLLWVTPIIAMVGMGSLYAGYVLLIPMVVIGGAVWAVWALAPLLGIRRNLARDQIGRAPWRSAGICWMLMVGLSLVVFFAIRGESITAAWDFPSNMPATFVWTHDPVPRSVIEPVSRLPGVIGVTPINDVRCSAKPKKQSVLGLFSSTNIFVAGDPDTFLPMCQLDFIEGDQADAEAKFRKGGYVLLPIEASHSLGYHLGEKIPITMGGITHQFEVAGVVRSPAMDIAVSYFQADTYMMIAAGASVLGTLDDLERCFQNPNISMLMANIELPQTDPPKEFHADTLPDTDHRRIAEYIVSWLDRLPLERDVAGKSITAIEQFAKPGGRIGDAKALGHLSRFRAALNLIGEQWAELSPNRRWEIFQENLVLGSIRTIMQRPGAMIGSLRRLKQDIDHDIRTATLIISAIPLICILVASIGVANLMMVNVTSRSRPIAILRAVGATKWQIARLVLAEAMVLGLLGCAVGVALGIHAAASTNLLTDRMIGIPVPLTVPWDRVIGAVILTWVICVLSGIGPAMRASRNNIIDAMSIA